MITDVQLERKRWRAVYPEEFDDGFQIGFFGKARNTRDPAGGGYPLDFHGWSENRKNAWFSGSNLGYVKRLQIDVEIGAAQTRRAADGPRNGQSARIKFSHARFGFDHACLALKWR